MPAFIPAVDDFDAGEPFHLRHAVPPGQLPTSMWGPLGKVEVYGKKYPIQDCRSGVCYDGYLYYNGYIPANRNQQRRFERQTERRDGGPRQLQALPDAAYPDAPPNGGSSADPNFPFYESNTVFVPPKNGTLQRVDLNPNLHPMQNQYLLGPMLWSMNASAFKSIQLKEGMFLRFNIDFFNVFNMPGTNLPNSTTGIILNQTSANSPRIVQLTGRLSW